MKFAKDNLRPDAAFATQLRKQRELFREATGTKKQLFNTIVSTYGIEMNEFALSQVDQNITIDSQFT
jgi:hypothetical protein